MSFLLLEQESGRCQREEDEEGCVVREQLHPGQQVGDQRSDWEREYRLNHPRLRQLQEGRQAQLNRGHDGHTRGHPAQLHDAHCQRQQQNVQVSW